MNRPDYSVATAPAKGAAVKLEDNLYWLRLPLPIALDHINVWLLDDGDSWTIIDTGLRAEETIQAWKGFQGSLLKGKPVARVIVTHHHPDHIGLAHWLCESGDVEFCMTGDAHDEAHYFTQAVLDDIRTSFSGYFLAHGITEHDDFLSYSAGTFYRRIISGVPALTTVINDNDEITIGGRTWRAMISGGHARGHLSLYNQDSGILISGDQVLPDITCNISAHPRRPGENPLQEYFDSLERFLLLPRDLRVLPSHGGVFLGLHERIAAIKADHNEKLDRTFDYCKGRTSAAEMTQLLFNRELNTLHRILAFGETLSHLRYLEVDNRLSCIHDTGRIYYSQ